MLDPVDLTNLDQDQILASLNGLDQAADRLSVNALLNRSIPTTGISLNDLLDSPSEQRDWGDLLRFEETAANYFAEFDPASPLYDEANLGLNPDSDGLVSAIASQINVLSSAGFVNADAFSFVGGRDAATGDIRFDLAIDAEKTETITPDLDALGSQWTDLGVVFDPGATVDLHSTADIYLTFGIGLDQPFSLEQFDIATSVDETGTLAYSLGGDAIDGDITTGTGNFRADAGANITLAGGGSLDQQLQIASATTTDGLNINLGFNDVVYSGTNRTFIDSDLLDVTPATPGGNAVAVALNASGQSLIDALEGIADWIDDAVADEDNTNLQTVVPLANRTLADLLTTPTQSVDFNGTSEVTIAALPDVANQYTATLVGVSEAASIGIKSGDTVRFLATTGDRFPATISRVEGNVVTFGYDEDRGDEPDTATTSVTFQIGTSLGGSLRSTLERYHETQDTPSIAMVLSDLSVLLGTPTLSTSGSTLSLTPVITPEAIQISTRLDFGEQIEGLEFDDSADFEISATPMFTLPLEIDLSDGSLQIGSGADVRVALSAEVDDPVFTGAAGFLNAVLNEQTASSVGIKLDANLDFDIAGGTQAVSDLQNSDLVVSVDAGSAVDIPGLTITPSGLAGTSGNVTVATSGPVGFTDFAGLAGAYGASGIVVNEATPLERFEGLTPSDVVATFVRLGGAIESISDNLDVPGGIPFVEDAITTVTDFTRQASQVASILFDNAIIVGEDEITATTGQLESDATFVVRIEDADAVFVTVTADSTADNATIDDLYIDINAALADAGLGEDLIAERLSGDDANRLSIRTIDPSRGTTIDITTLQVTGISFAPSSGRVGEEVNLRIAVNTENIDEEVSVDIALPIDVTQGNTSLSDLVRDLNAAMEVNVDDDTLLSDLFVALVEGENIRIAAVDSTATSISISGGENLGFGTDQTADDNPAASVLGLGVSTGALAELRIDTIGDMIDVLNEIMPTATTLAYDAANDRVTFNLNLEETFSETIDLNFARAIDLGFGDLNLAGGADAIFEVTAGIDLAVGLDLTRAGSGQSVSGTTLLSSLGDSGVSLKVGVTSTNVADPTVDTLQVEIKRFGQAASTVDIQLDADDFSDNDTFASGSGNAAAADLAFDIRDQFAAQGIAVRAEALDDDRLVLISDDPEINSITVTQAAFGFEVGDSGDQYDLLITLGDGTTVDVNLDGSEDLDDVKDAIEAAGPTLSVEFVGDQIHITDSSTIVEDNRLTIAAGSDSFGTSPAGAVLGILSRAADEDDETTVGFNEDRTVVGEHLRLGDILDQFFIDTSATSVFANATIDASEIDLNASLGLLELGVDGGFFGDVALHGDGVSDANAFSIAAGISLPDNGDGDGFLRLSDFGGQDLSDALAAVVPTFSYGGSATFPIAIPLTGDSQEVSFELQNDGLRPTFNVSAQSILDLRDKVADFRNLSLSDIAGLLHQVVDLLRDSDIDGLNDSIPVINRTPNELLGFTDGLLAAANRLLEGPDASTLQDIRNQLAGQISFVTGSPGQIASLNAALDRVTAAINPVHAYELEINHDGGTVRTEMIFSTATALDIEAMINEAIGLGDVVDVAGRTGSPFTLTFDSSLGDVSLDASSASGLTTQFETTTEGVLDTESAVIELEFVESSGLVASLSSLQSVVSDLEAAGIEIDAIQGLVSELTGGVVSTENLGDFLTDLISEELGLPVTVGVDFIDADSATDGFQATLKLELGIEAPTEPITTGFDLALGDFGPVTLAAGGDVEVDFGGSIDLDVGFNFANLTPYIFDSTQFSLTAGINAGVNATATIGGFEAGLSGAAVLHNGDGVSPASISVSVDQNLAPTDSNTIGGIPIAQFFSAGLGNALDFALAGEVDVDFDADLPSVGDVEDAIQLLDFDPFGSGTPTIDFSNLTTGVNEYLAGLTDLSGASLDQLIDGTRAVLTTIESGLTSDLLSSIPLVGDGIDLGASFVGELQSLVDDFEILINESEDSIDALVDDLKTVIYDALGPLGANILQLDPLFDDDESVDDANEVADFRDVAISLSDLSSTPPAEVELSISLDLAGRDVIDADFDLGLDAVAFEFETAGGVELVFDYEFNLGFGINLRDGFFFELNQNTNFDEDGFDDGTGGSPEIELGAEVRLKPGTTLSGELFLSLIHISEPTRPY